MGRRKWGIGWGVGWGVGWGIRRKLTTMAIIEVRELVKRYGSLTAVNGVSFEVNEGEIFGIVGPNGAGKTTTLEIIETLKQPTSGQVVIDGFDARRDPWRVKRLIGVQLQAAGFYPGLTLRELLQLF